MKKNISLLEEVMYISNVTDTLYDHLRHVQQKARQIMEAYEDQEDTEAMDLMDKVDYLHELLRQIADIVDMLIGEAGIRRCPNCGYFRCVCR